ncbi:hypothetical protein [Mycolicibacter heraklionensis]|uniref:8-oxoguanine DNA glycosylase OGG fold protein n=1 Tax=Mycolicibacter heraklionensis TaxID=512402 RepID=UPI000D68C309|nr:hypothetical protein [Mycolicibacter heraklionensis]
MTATPLTDIHLPMLGTTQLRSVDVAEWIYGHAIPADRRWWTQALAAHGFADTLIGDTICRADIFALADAAPSDPQAALTLLWNSLAWGSGDKLRNNRARIASIAADRDGAAAVLQQAAALSRTDPQGAYHLLYPRNRTAICNLGPAFFTKYLYFAGGGDPCHPCCILDENVALALQKTCGWKSLPLRGWLASAYQRYATLLGLWVDEHSLGRPDVIERWLFEEGKRVRNDTASKPVRSMRYAPDEKQLVPE